MVKDIEIFRIPVEYYLERENYIVNIPVKAEVEYPLNILNRKDKKVINIVIPKGDTYLANRKSKINVYQSRIYQRDIRVRYSFLSGNRANYVGMVKLTKNI